MAPLRAAIDPDEQHGFDILISGSTLAAINRIDQASRCSSGPLNESMIQNITPFIDWANKNSGFVSIIIFAISVFFAWVTGIFRSLIKKPKFKIRVIPGQPFPL